MGMLEEYHFNYSKAKKNPYAGRLEKKVISLDSDVAEVFPDSDSVNKALRAIISIYPKKKSKKVSA
ncbi:MAG: hypothetical protein FJ213_07480 [Ignavibacteria bacterium]|nr:hypothetical protein [Ignavibacteria bacterium]